MVPTKKGSNKSAGSARSGFKLKLKNTRGYRAGTDSEETSGTMSSTLSNASNSSTSPAATSDYLGDADDEATSNTPISSSMAAATSPAITTPSDPNAGLNDASVTLATIHAGTTSDNTTLAVSTQPSRTSSSSSLASRRGFNPTIDVGGPPVFAEDAAFPSQTPQPPSPDSKDYRFPEPSTPEPEIVRDPIRPAKLGWGANGRLVPAASPTSTAVTNRWILPNMNKWTKNSIDMSKFDKILLTPSPVSVFQAYAATPLNVASSTAAPSNYPPTTLSTTSSGTASPPIVSYPRYAPASPSPTSSGTGSPPIVSSPRYDPETGLMVNGAGGPSVVASSIPTTSATAPPPVRTQVPTDAGSVNNALATTVSVAGPSTVTATVSTIPRVGTTTTPPTDAKLTTPWHCGNRDCQSGQTWMPVKETGRKVISEFFGKNKKETRRIPEDVWHYYCRIDYQRESYRNEETKAFQLAQLDKVRAQLVRIGLWRPNARFSIQLKKAMEDRLNEYKKIMNSNGGDRDAAMLKLDSDKDIKQNKKTQEQIISSVDACPFDVATEFESELARTDAPISRCMEIVDFMEKVINERSLRRPLPIEFLLQEARSGEVPNDPSTNYSQWIAHEDALAAVAVASGATPALPAFPATSAPRRTKKTKKSKAAVKKEAPDAESETAAQVDANGDTTMLVPDDADMDIQAVKGLLLLSGQHRTLPDAEIERALARQAIVAMTAEPTVLDYQYGAAVHHAAAAALAGLLGSGSAAKRKRAEHEPTTPQTSPPAKRLRSEGPAAPSRLSVLAEVAAASPSSPLARRD